MGRLGKRRGERHDSTGCPPLRDYQVAPGRDRAAGRRRGRGTVCGGQSLLATIALALAGLQVLLALWMYRKLPLPGPPRRVPLAHRLTGFVLFALTVPVAVHCLIAYGVQLTSARVAIHSVAGCFFYGAFAAKVLAVQSRRLPGWVLPLAGGTLAIVLGVLWYTSALWYYHGYQLPHL